MSGGLGAQENRERQEAFDAMVALFRGSYPIMIDVTAGGGPLLRFQHGGIVFNLVISRSRYQRTAGEWQ